LRVGRRLSRWLVASHVAGAFCLLVKNTRRRRYSL
jgi:hypothetical protein